MVGIVSQFLMETTRKMLTTDATVAKLKLKKLVLLDCLVKWSRLNSVRWMVGRLVMESVLKAFVPTEERARLTWSISKSKFFYFSDGSVGVPTVNIMLTLCVTLFC